MLFCQNEKTHRKLLMIKWLRQSKKQRQSKDIFALVDDEKMLLKKSIPKMPKNKYEP